jgi:hypothetical protein
MMPAIVRPTERAAHWGLLLAAAIMIPFGLATALRTPPIPPNTPPALDRFLTDIARATPAHARLLVAGSLTSLVFYRGTVRLYPRPVVGYLVRDYTTVSDWVGVPATWAQARQYARHTHARYVALWGTAIAPPPTSVLMRRDSGVLAAVSR